MAAILCPSPPVIELMKNRARTLIYTPTALPPATIAAAAAPLDLIAAQSLRRRCRRSPRRAPSQPVPACRRRRSPDRAADRR